MIVHDWLQLPRALNYLSLEATLYLAVKAGVPEGMYYVGVG